MKLTDMNVREELHEAIDRMDDSQLAQLISMARAVEAVSPTPVDLAAQTLLQRLKAIPNIQVPRHWPPHFRQVIPAKIEGEPASEILIRERR